MIALENMTRVDSEKPGFVPTKNWNWRPEVTDTAAIDRTYVEASHYLTSRQTLTTQVDHGEGQ